MHGNAAHRRPRPRVHGRVGAALAILAIAAAGCQLTLDVGVDINRHGGGKLTLQLTTDEAFAAWARSEGVAPLDVITDARQQLQAAGWRVTEQTDGGGRTVRLAHGFADPEEFERLTADLATALAGPELVLLEPMKLAVTDQRVRLEGRASLQPGAAVAEHGLTPPEAVAWLRGEPPSGAPASEGVTYRVTATMPGEVLRSSATGRRGRTLIWTVPPGEEVIIRAVARRPSAPQWPLLVGALAGAGTAAAGVMLWRRRGPRIGPPNERSHADESSRSAERRSFSART